MKTQTTKTKKLTLLLIISLMFALAYSFIFIASTCKEEAHASTKAPANSVAVYRMYNFLSSEHLFTTNKSEVDNLKKLTNQKKSHWEAEGVNWYAPKSGTPVYRLYNAKLGKLGRCSHYYTSDTKEIKKLCTKRWGWKNEGISFYSGGTTPIYTAYSEALGSQHHYTSDKSEWSKLDLGWDIEGDKNGGKFVSYNKSKRYTGTKKYYKNYTGDYTGFFLALASGDKAEREHEWETGTNLDNYFSQLAHVKNNGLKVVCECGKVFNGAFSGDPVNDFCLHKWSNTPELGGRCVKGSESAGGHGTYSFLLKDGRRVCVLHTKACKNCGKRILDDDINSWIYDFVKKHPQYSLIMKP